MELKGIVESLIFASARPLTLQQLRSLTNTPLRQLKAVVEELQAHHQEAGIQLVEVGGGYQFRTHPDAANWVRRLLAGKPQRLTRPMLETLAIIAYQQPITRPEIEEIRGVDCGNTLRLLLERNLLRILGKKEEAGRPMLYGTTKYFLEFFQLASLKDLPTLKEFTELSPEHEDQVEFYFGNRGDPNHRVQASEVLEGPPEPPHLRPRPRVVADDGLAFDRAEAMLDGDDQGAATPVDVEAATPVEGEAAASVGVQATTPLEGEAATPLEGEAPTPVDVEAAAPLEGEAAASAPPAPVTVAVHAAPHADEDDEDDAVLASLDRAIARAGSVLREINPKPKSQPRSEQEALDDAAVAAESADDVPEAAMREDEADEGAPQEDAVTAASAQP